MKKIISFFVLTTMVTALTVQANNIQVSNVYLNERVVGLGVVNVNFDISWQNSWRTITNESNYDGAWIFVKYRIGSSSAWQHASLLQSGSIAPAGSVLQTSLDKKGAWIYHTLPTSNFTGNVNYSGARIRWNYAADGVFDNDSVEIKVFAIEMVYVPQGKFYLGSGGTELNHFEEGNKTTPYLVTSENAITVAYAAGNLYYTGNTLIGDGNGPIPAGFPKGYQAFWLMKYECSQQQYVDFLNNLPLAHASNRYDGTVYTGTHPNLLAPFPERAAINFSLDDIESFADWAALRPFTEMEFEKACRGANQPAVPNEYPWGNTTITATTATINTGLSNEAASNGNANYGSSLSGPVRTGIYATATSNRQQSGATFYGIMEMGGNSAEGTINAGFSSGRSFTGTNGDGSLDVNGNANVANWPLNGRDLNLRGGAWSTYFEYLATSNRFRVYYYNLPADRVIDASIRVARTAE